MIFPRIPDSQCCYIVQERNRSQSQLSVKLWILKIAVVLLVQFSTFKVLQKAGTEIYSFLVKYKTFENPEIWKNQHNSSTERTCLSLMHKELTTGKPTIRDNFVKSHNQGLYICQVSSIWTISVNAHNYGPYI